MKILKHLILAVLVALSAAGAAFGAEVRFGHAAPTWHGLHQGALALAQKAAEATGGEIVVKVHPGADLGPEAHVLENLMADNFELAAVSMTVLADTAPVCRVFELPFLWPDRPTLYNVLADPEFQKQTFDQLGRYKFIPLGFYVDDFQDIVTIRRAVTGPSSLAGLNIQVDPASLRREAFTAWGAAPKSLPFTMTAGAMEQGLIDGREMPALEALVNGVTKKARFVTRSRHAAGIGLILASPRFWRSLSGERKTAFMEAAARALETNRRVDRANRERVLGLEVGLDEALRAAGVQVTELDDETRRAMIRQVAPLVEKETAKAPKFSEFLFQRIEQIANQTPAPEMEDGVDGDT